MHHFIPHVTAARRRKSNRPLIRIPRAWNHPFRNQPLADGKPQTDTFHIIVHLDEACEKALQFIFCNAGSRILHIKFQTFIRQAGISQRDTSLLGILNRIIRQIIDQLQQTDTIGSETARAATFSKNNCTPSGIRSLIEANIVSISPFISTGS